MVSLQFEKTDEGVDEEFVHDVSTVRIAAMIPELFTSYPPITDDLKTQTSQTQFETVEECLPFLAAEPGGDRDGVEYTEHGIARLNRDRHIAFLRRWLEQRMSHHYTAVDASRPWFLYWCLEGLDLLGVDVSVYSERLVQTAGWMQNPAGGFGGGFGQMSHLAATYATVLALAIVGSEEAYNVIDRLALWKWLSSLKQPNGGFSMAVGGEVDVRGAYCASVIISLLDLPLEISPQVAGSLREGTDLYTGLAEYVQRCQTFEGGISGKPDGEAHGAYAFCALGCLSILGVPHEIIPKYLDVPRLISWMSSRQYAPEGGFSGRTNKLVDGCYSHWIGGCWPLVEACLQGPPGFNPVLAPNSSSLHNREALIRYTLNCCQGPFKRGGLRDKPSRHPDAYHTCYVLAGLSSAQHSFAYTRKDQEDWGFSPNVMGVQIFNEEDRLATLHPVYVIPLNKVTAAKKYFASKSGF